MFFNYFESSNDVSIDRDGREGEMRGSMVKCAERPLEGGERGGGGNWGTHIGGYLVLLDGGIELCHKTAEIYFPGMRYSTSEYTKRDAVVADGDEMCKNSNLLQSLPLESPTW